MSRQRRAATLALAFTLMAPSSLQTLPGQAQALGSSPTIAYNDLLLPRGRRAVVYSNGLARIYPNAKDRADFETRWVGLKPQPGPGAVVRPALPSKDEIIAKLAKEPLGQPYLPGEVVVVYRSGVSSLDTVTVSLSAIAALRKAAARHQLTAANVPQYTNDATTNRTLAQLGVDRSDRLFKQFNRSTLGAMRSGVTQNRRPALDFSNAYRIHITNASVRHAVGALAKLSAVAYASPNFIVETMNTDPVRLNQLPRTIPVQRISSLETSAGLTSASVPTNYAVSSSLQSMLNAPSDDVIAAYDEIKRHFNQLPGQGEIITNVSLGDLDDASAATNSSDPCNFWASVFGPTTEVISGQRYINWPSMPLIPTYTADSNGNLSGTGEVCGVDPFLGEVGLDFSMMAPLPDQVQRGGEQGSGFTDLFGIAPGAQFRLVVPGSATASTSDIDAAFLGAALQNPRPNVISASLGFGLDVYGFPSRYLEDDPLTEAIIASIVQSYHIVVVISANDGTRQFTFAATGPSGGSAATNVVAPGGTPTDLNDVAFSTVPSLDFDSGSIDAGATTLDDIFSNPPQWTSSPFLKAQHAYAETRWTGFTSFSSGYGSRVNLAAPGDNVISFIHNGSAADAVGVGISGGTSASAPEIAAAAAVVEQVARLTGHPFSDPVKLGAFLQQTGTPVPPVSQADTNVNVGPQVDVRRAIETLLGQAGIHDKATVARVGIEQRRPYANVDDDGLFLTYTDPANIDLRGDALFGDRNDDNRDQFAWITIAPDWEFIPPVARYSLTIAGTSKVLATTPWARLLPATILSAAGLPMVSSSNRTVKLTYSAIGGGKAVSVTFSLTFGPADAVSYEVLAPNVPSIVRGNTIPVTYDISNIWGHLPHPALSVAEPGRVNDWAVQQGGAGMGHNPQFIMPLTAPKGTVQVPVSALQGGGIYGIVVGGTGSYPIGGIAIGCACDFAYARVQPQQAADTRPAAPLLSSNSSAPGHFLDIPYNGTFQLSYDVRNVPGATGAELEISAAGPVLLPYGTNYNTFNNPNGSQRDHNGIDSGSVYFAPLSGTSGTVTLNGNALGLYSAMTHTVRVIPTKFGEAAGEASDVSAITMDGVVPSDGGSLGLGFGVNGNGLDGFITSNQLLLSFSGGQFQVSASGSLETFDQTTNAIAQDLAGGRGSVFFTAPVGRNLSGPLAAPGMYGNDIGLFGSASVTDIPSLINLSVSYHLLNPTAGSIGSSWTPQISQPLITAASNRNSDTAVFLSGQLAQGPYSVFASQITQNTFGPSYDITAPMKNFAQPEVWGLAQDTSANMALAVSFDFANRSVPPTIITVNLASGSVDSFSGVGRGIPNGIIVDSTTHRAAVPTDDGGISIYTPSTKSGFEVFPPGPGHTWIGQPAVDETHHLFLFADIGNDEVFPGLIGPQGNLNALSQVLVVNENGNIVESVSHFNLLMGGTIFASYVQVNPTRRIGYVIGPGGTELATFSY